MKIVVWNHKLIRVIILILLVLILNLDRIGVKYPTLLGHESHLFYAVNFFSYFHYKGDDLTSKSSITKAVNLFWQKEVSNLTFNIKIYYNLISTVIQALDKYILLFFFACLMWNFCCYSTFLFNRIIDTYNQIDSIYDIYSFMSSNIPNTNSTTTIPAHTSQVIVNRDTSTSDTIRTGFFYGVGAWRLLVNYSRNGTIFSRLLIGTTAIAAEATSKILNNQINDPDYFNRQVDAGIAIKSKMKVIFGKEESTREVAAVDLTKVADKNFVENISNAAKADVETKNVLNDASLDLSSNTSATTSSNINNFSSNGGDSLLDSYSNLINSWFEIFKSILEPVSVSYSNEVLSNQLYNISIILFILSIALLILLTAFVVNIISFIYSEKLLQYFTNKYIVKYISFNREIIKIEIVVVGFLLIYIMYQLAFGLHFLATHPIILD